MIPPVVRKPHNLELRLGVIPGSFSVSHTVLPGFLSVFIVLINATTTTTTITPCCSPCCRPVVTPQLNLRPASQHPQQERPGHGQQHHCQEEVMGMRIVGCKKNKKKVRLWILLLWMPRTHNFQLT
jgi:hypothetical protein